MQAADARWRQRRQAAVLLAWRAHASAAADWLHDTGTALRRRWLLRQWRAVVAERQWQRDAEAVADAWVRQRTLAAAVAAWRQCVRHELWRDAVHEAVVQQRLRHVISG